jgi:NADH:ubiquinone oxidoreductase subunit E
MAWAASFVGISPVEVLGVLTFYWMYDRSPRAKFRIAVCRNISCDLRGAQEIIHALEKKLGIESDKPAKEGAKFALREVECMGSCTTAPMMDVNGSYFEELTPEMALEIIDQIEKGEISLPPQIETLPEVPKNLAHSYGNHPGGTEEAF